jgi:hypothetical protein
MNFWSRQSNRKWGQAEHKFRPLECIPPPVRGIEFSCKRNGVVLERRGWFWRGKGGFRGGEGGFRGGRAVLEGGRVVLGRIDQVCGDKEAL